MGGTIWLERPIKDERLRGTGQVCFSPVVHLASAHHCRAQEPCSTCASPSALSISITYPTISPIFKEVFLSHFFWPPLLSPSPS